MEEELEAVKRFGAFLRYKYPEPVFEDDDIDLSHDEDDMRMEQQRCDCSNCMDCLGLTWRDFM